MYTYLGVSADYTEVAVMEQVSHAERWVNEYCGQTFTAGAAPDGVKSATLEMARYFMNVQMQNDKYIEEFTVKLPTIILLCKTYLEKNKVSISYSSSKSDYNLNVRRG